jgi:hypothetical protein
MSNFALRLPEDLKKEATALAKASGMSLNQFINNSLAGKVAADREAKRFFDARASRQSGGAERLTALLDKAGDGKAPRKDDR